MTEATLTAPPAGATPDTAVGAPPARCCRRTRPPPWALDRRLGSRGSRAVGRARPRDRQAQPGLVDLRRVPRLRGLAAVEHRRGPAARRRLHARQQPDLLADLDAEPGRRDAADPLHVPRPALRRPQLDDHLRRACC